MEDTTLSAELDATAISLESVESSVSRPEFNRRVENRSLGEVVPVSSLERSVEHILSCPQSAVYTTVLLCCGGIPGRFYSIHAMGDLRSRVDVVDK